MRLTGPTQTPHSASRPPRTCAPIGASSVAISGHRWCVLLKQSPSSLLLKPNTCIRHHGPVLVCGALRYGRDDDDQREGEDEEGIEEDYEDDSEDGLASEDFEDVRFTSEQAKENTLVWAEYMNLNVVGTPLAELEGLDASATPMTSSTAPVGAKAKTYKKVESQPQSQPVDPADALLQKALESSSSLRFLYGPTLPMRHNSGPRSEWDFRASMEKRRRMERERAAWLEENARNVGRFSAVASDWRNDVRITDTGNPKDPEYREWTLREIWDMINLSGVSLDPRDVPFKATQPGSTADCVAEGFIQEPEIPEWLAQQGRIIEEDDENDIIDRDAEALLGSEFSDFEDFSPGDSVLGDPIEDGLILDQF